MDRPTSGNCAATLADGSTCGAPFAIKPAGNMPKYCPEHRDQYLRKQLERQAKALAEGEPMGQPPDEPAGSCEPTDEAARVCRAGGCSIPLPDVWLNEFCPADWRILPGDVKAELVGSRGDEDLHERAVFHALRALSNRATIGQEFDYTHVS